MLHRELMNSFFIRFCKQIFLFDIQYLQFVISIVLHKLLIFPGP